MVALQALALYSTLVSSPDGSTKVMVTSPTTSFAFLVNKENKLLYQEKELADIVGKHVLQASGSGCATVQVSRYSHSLLNFNTGLKAKGNCSHTSF